MNDLRSDAADADWQYRARQKHAERGTMPPLYREAGWPADAPGRVASRHGLTYFDAEWIELGQRERSALAEENDLPPGLAVFRIAERQSRGYYRRTRRLMPR